MKTILFVFATLLPGSVVSQVLLWDKVCVPGPGGYDISPAGTRAGDHDGDGLEDVLCPLFMRDAVTGYFMPQWTYVVLSSRTGKVLARQDIGYGDVANMNPVFHEGVGDFDGDRHLDWILSLTYSSGQIQLRSFSDVPVRSIPFSLPDNAAACGRAIAANLDLDGDGRPDLVTTLPQAPRALLRAYRNDFTKLWEVAMPPGLAVGRGIAALGRVDDDPYDDFVVVGNDPTGRGVALVISGGTGKILSYSYGERAGDLMNWSVANVGDIDSDGVADFVAGGRGMALRGTARLFSGRTGAALHTWVSPYPRGLDFGLQCVGGADVDLDGVPDLAIVSPEEQRIPGTALGTIYVISGRTKAVLHELHPAESGGFSAGDPVMMLVPARKPNEFPILVYNESRHTVARQGWIAQGRMVGLSLQPVGTSQLASGCSSTGGKAPLLGLSKEPLPGLTAGKRVRVTLSGVCAPSVACLVMTARPGSTPPWNLMAIGSQSGACSLATPPSLVIPVKVESDGRSGYAYVDLPWSYASRNQSQAWVTVQWAVMGAQGPEVSACYQIHVE